MHYTRISAFLLGALLLGSVFMAYVAAGNFQTVTELLKSAPPQAEKMIQTLGAQDARLLLRYLAGEENRLFFQAWERVALVLAAALAAFLYLGVKRRRLAALAGAAVILVALQHFRITPELVWQGRSIDFVPGNAGLAAREHFMKLHAAYGVIEAVKLLLLLAITAFLLPRRRRAHRHVQVDAIDYAHHRHVDG